MKLKIILSFCLLFCITGCSNYQELNDLAIASALGIDKTENGFRVTTQIINTEKNSGSYDSSGQPKFITYTAEGTTLNEAFRNIVFESSRKLYPNHAEVIVIGHELAEAGIYPIFDMFFRNADIRKQSLMIVSIDNTAEEILKVTTPLALINAEKIKSTLEADAKFLGTTDLVTFEKMLANYLSDTKQIMLPAITIINENNIGNTSKNIESTEINTKLLLSSLVVFKNDKMIGHLTQEESLAVSFIMGKVNTTIITHKCENNNHLTIEIIDTNTKTTNFKNKSKIKLTISASAVLNENTCNLDLESPKTFKDIETSINDQLKNQIYKTIHDVNEKYNTDVYGFLDLIYKNNPKYYNKIKDNWYNDGLVNLEIDASVDVKLIFKGSGLKGIYDE